MKIVNLKHLYRLALVIIPLAVAFSNVAPAAAAIDYNSLMDDAIFDNYNSMSASQIDTFLNGFSSSCISTNNGFSAPDPTGYSPSNGFTFGSNVSAGKVIYDAAQAYQINPQVLLATMQKEQSLVTGSAGCYPNNPDPSWPSSGSPAPNTTFTCTINGSTTCTYACPYSGGCINIAMSYNCPGYCRSEDEGLSMQVITAAWSLKFDRERAEGNTSWAIISGSWDNSDDLETCYYGFMTQGTLQRCPSGASNYYDGYATLNDNNSVHMDNGATAALYDYTPYESGNTNFETIFTSWFGSPIVTGLPGCAPATNTTLTCVWYMKNPGNGDQYLTSSINARDEVYIVNSYQYVGIDFYGNVVPMPGNIAVYRADEPGGGSFLTTNITEYNNLVATGWAAGGIDFYADPPGSNDGFPVYRLYNPSTEQHYWTGSAQEEASMVQNGWTSEGVPFNSIDLVRQETPPPSGDNLVYRFYIPQTYSHFWTTDLGERDQMIAAGYDYEGVAWYSSTNSSDTPVYRLYAPSIRQHLYTTDISEVNRLVASGGWQNEGVDQYVTMTPNSSPVYRLYAPSLGVHMFTADPNERAVLLASGHWNDEGVGWYQP